MSNKGSVWIGLILLKLKTYCWNHCSKIIFKCVNSTVGPIFNEKVAKKWNLWVHEQYMMHCLLQKSQHLRLLFIKQYMNSNHVSPKRMKKKKKEQKLKTQTCIQTSPIYRPMCTIPQILIIICTHIYIYDNIYVCQKWFKIIHILRKVGQRMVFLWWSFSMK